MIIGREISVGLVANATSPVSCAAEALLADGAARSRSFQQVGPAPADPAVQEATLLSRSVATFLGPLDYATFTFRIEPEGTPYLIDVDLDASLHPQHTLARAFALGGIEYSRMIALILEASFRRWDLAR